MVAVSEKRRDDYSRWHARCENGRSLAANQKREVWDRLEDALSGYFPQVMDASGAALGARGSRVQVSEQLNANLLLWAATYYRAISYDDFPTFHYARNVKADLDVLKAKEGMAAQLFDEGGGCEEAAEALQSSMTRGPFMLWVDVVDESATPEQILAASRSPSDFTQSAIENPGEPIEIPEGADAEGIAEAAEAMISDPDLSLRFQPEQLDALRMLADAAKLVHLKSLEGPHPRSDRCRIKFTATPYGTWAWVDVSVTNLKRIGFIVRKLVYSPEEFLAAKTYNAKAKAYVRSRFDGAKGDGNASGANPTSGTGRTAHGEDLDSRERVTVYQIWDRVNWRRLALVDGFDDFAHASDKYPYLGPDGRPILRGFFPCAIRVPIKASAETAEGMTGVPLLEPGWPAQIEYIKVISAYVQATKRSARQALFAPGLEPSFITSLMAGKDGSGTALPPGYDHTRHGAPVTIMDWGDAPLDYLKAAGEARREFCTAVHIAQLTMTSESPNPNLGQDQLALSGAATMQGAVLRCYEGGTAEAVEIALTLMHAYASTEELTSYLGPGSDFREPIYEDAVDDATGIAGKRPVMTKDPETGEIVPATKPSLVDKVRAVSLDRERLTCRFAVNVEGDTAIRVNQMQNYIGLNNTTLNPLTQTPYKNPSSLMDELAEMQNIHGVEDFPADLAVAVSQTGGATGAGVEEREAPGGGRDDGRKKNGERGGASIPKKQERERGPQTRENMTATNNRAVSAT